MKTLINILIISMTLLTSMSAEKHGLVIAIGDYSEESLWPDISSNNDIPHITSAFKILGFKDENISVLTNADATKKSIIAAFKNLEGLVQKGDIVFIHYSGHGQQVVDDNGDELDGLDEAIVPHDSPLFFEEGVYEGENLVRDDLIGEMTLAIRKKIGKDGQLILVLDSCHSGSGTRGMGKSRGTDKIMAPANYKPKTRGGESAMGVIVSSEGAAPMASFFGASSKELNYETVDDQSKPVGSLSYALASVLATMNKNYSFGELFERVKMKMKHLAPHQNPQMEGPSDMYLFGDNTGNKDFLFPIVETISNTELVAGVGTIAEVFEGSVVEIVSLDDDSVKGTGEVTKAFLTECDIELDEALTAKDGELLKVRVVERMQPPLKCHVSNLVDASSPWNTVVQKVLESKVVDVTDNVADLYFKDTDGKLTVTDAHGITLYEKTFKESRAAVYQGKLMSTIKSYTQGKYIRAFESDNAFFDLSLDIKQVDCNDPTKVLSTSSETIKVGTCIKLQVKNQGKKAAYFSVLDIQPDNYINLIIPATSLGYTPDEYYLEPGEVFETSYTIEVAPPYGNEVMKLICTNEPIDLSGIMSSNGAASRGGTPGHSFEKIMAATYTDGQTRGAKVKKPAMDEVGTANTYFKIIE